MTDTHYEPLQTADTHKPERVATAEEISNGVTPADITRAYDKLVRNERYGWQSAVEFGELLLKARGDSKHGTFLKWLETNCPGISRSNANNYMRVADPEHRDVLKANVQRAGQFSMRGALRLIKPEPTEAQKQERKRKTAETKARNKEADKRAALTRPYHGGGSIDLTEMLRVYANEPDVILLSFDHAFKDRKPEELEWIGQGLLELAKERRRLAADDDLPSAETSSSEARDAQ
jgi:hypothetical protein